MEKLIAFIRNTEKENVHILFDLAFKIGLGLSFMLSFILYIFYVSFQLFLVRIGIGTEVTYHILLDIPLMFIVLGLYSYLCQKIIIEILDFVIKPILKRFI